MQIIHNKPYNYICLTIMQVYGQKMESQMKNIFLRWLNCVNPKN